MPYGLTFSYSGSRARNLDLDRTSILVLLREGYFRFTKEAYNHAEIIISRTFVESIIETTEDGDCAFIQSWRWPIALVSVNCQYL